MFAKLARYPKKKNGNKSSDDLKTFTEETKKEIDLIFCAKTPITGKIKDDK